MRRGTPLPPEREKTLRQRIIEHLLAGPADSRELSTAVGIPQKEVITHLEHIQRSLHGTGLHFEIVPAECRSCGFVFRKRDRIGKPGKCPLCHKQYIQEAYFFISRIT